MCGLQSSHYALTRPGPATPRWPRYVPQKQGRLRPGALCTVRRPLWSDSMPEAVISHRHPISGDAGTSARWACFPGAAPHVLVCAAQNFRWGCNARVVRDITR